ncbi:hypothetical protein VNO77_00747 [Canavalia gladiata]|uniref:Uncharacterized protein n=1 Tax=Canavalia gladiata TaxID=3824 RepID=A0AAN9MWH7_CANGL
MSAHFILANDYTQKQNHVTKKSTNQRPQSIASVEELDVDDEDDDEDDDDDDAFFSYWFCPQSLNQPGSNYKMMPPANNGIHRHSLLTTGNALYIFFIPHSSLSLPLFACATQCGDNHSLFCLTLALFRIAKV